MAAGSTLCSFGALGGARERSCRQSVTGLSNTALAREKTSQFGHGKGKEHLSLDHVKRAPEKRASQAEIKKRSDRETLLA